MNRNWDFENFFFILEMFKNINFMFRGFYQLKKFLSIKKINFEPI